MLHEILHNAIQDDPGRPVLEFDGQFWTAEDLDHRARNLAARLMRLGMEPIDRLAVLLPNCPPAVEAYLACFKANFVVVPLDYRHPAPQIGYALNHSGADALVVHHSRLAELEDAGLLSGISHVIVVGGELTNGRQYVYDDFVNKSQPSRFPEDFEESDLCIMIYTSGTTSRPKGVTLTRGAMTQGIKKFLSRVSLNKDDIALVAAPITRPMALRCQLLPILYVGGCVSLLERFTVEGYLSALQRKPAKTFLSLLPSALGRVLSHPDISRCDFSSLRLCMSGGDRVPLEMHSKFQAVTGLEITEQCGASEIGPYAQNPPFGRKKPGSIGLPMYGTQVCLVDEKGNDVATGEVGEILVNSPMMMDGYWNDTAMTRKTLHCGFIRTGDLGRYDEDGYLWFMGRKKDVIVRGGSNISPLEIENALLQHKTVGQACVVGLLNEEWGQVVHAFVVPCHEADCDPAALLEHCRENLAEYMVPEAIQVLDEMPVKGAGKIDRDILRMRAEIGPLIEKVSFFRSVSENFIRDIVPRLEAKEFEQGTTVFREGDVGNAMYFLTRGKVDVLVACQDERLATLSEGAYFGELAILKESPRNASIRTVTDCEVFELKRASVLELAETYPEFSQHIREALEHYENS